MGLHAKILKYSRFVSILVALSFLAAMFMVMPAEIVPAEDEHDCEEHCEDACQGCTDCLHCFSKVQFIMTFDTAVYEFYLHMESAINAPEFQSENIFASNIDHPPQNIS